MGKFSLEETVKYNKSGPARYCCRTDVWKEAAMVLPSFGKRAVVSGGARSRASVREKLFPALKAAGIQYVVNEFSGESSMGNVKKI